LTIEISHGIMMKCIKPYLLWKLSMSVNSICKWTGTLLFLTAALLLSSNIEMSKYGYIIFLFGHLILSYFFWFRVRDNAMFTHNFFFILIDCWGIYRWFLA
jgi:hypothetical protein